jgi:8-oxo-dGTP diphosphatase
MAITVLTQVYALNAGRLLLLKRRRGPNRGLWVAPGGRVDNGEAPCEAARREFHEETGLAAQNLLFRGAATLVAQDTNRTSLTFLYACTLFSGSLLEQVPEGRLKWQHLHRVFDLPMPETHQPWLHHALNINLPPYHARIVYNALRQVVAVHDLSA